MLHDAIHDNLTGLPNRELFHDRLDTAALSGAEAGRGGADRVRRRHRRFQEASTIPTACRWATRRCSPSRAGWRATSSRATRWRACPATSSASSFSATRGRPTSASGSTRCARRSPRRSASASGRSRSPSRSARPRYDPKLHVKGGDLLADAQLALANAKKAGGDRAELFTRIMRSYRSDRQSLENDMRHALERGEIMVLFRPIVRLEDRTVAGFQALDPLASCEARRPRRGRIRLGRRSDRRDRSISAPSPSRRAARELAAWQKALEVNPPIFATVGASSRQMLGHDLLTDVRSALSRHFVQRGSLKLAVAESLVMENPEYAAVAPAARARDRRGR